MPSEGQPEYCLAVPGLLVGTWANAQSQPASISRLCVILRWSRKGSHNLSYESLLHSAAHDGIAAVVDSASFMLHETLISAHTVEPGGLDSNPSSAVS